MTAQSLDLQALRELAGTHGLNFDAVLRATMEIGSHEEPGDIKSAIDCIAASPVQQQDEGPTDRWKRMAKHAPPLWGLVTQRQLAVWVPEDGDHLGNFYRLPAGEYDERGEPVEQPPADGEHPLVKEWYEGKTLPHVMVAKMIPELNRLSPSRPVEALEVNEGFRRGIKTAFDTVKIMAANNWHGIEDQQRICDIENVALARAADEILHLSPEDEATWNSLVAAEARATALQGKVDGLKERCAQIAIERAVMTGSPVGMMVETVQAVMSAVKLTGQEIAAAIRALPPDGE